MSRLARSAFFWFTLFVAASELLAWWSLPYRLVPKADVAIRNPLSHRAWPEYLDAEHDARPLVVLISNSQGVGGEIPDDDKIYAAALRAHVARSGYRFENWSARGLRTTELEILTLEAVERGARHVIVVVAANNFDPPERVDLRYPLSDIPLLAGAPSLWPELGGALFMKRTEASDLAWAFVALRSNLARSRLAVIDLLASRLPLALHRFAFGRQVRPGERLDSMNDPAISVYLPAVDLAQGELAERRASRSADPESWKIIRPAERFTTFAAIFPGLAARFSTRGIRMSWIWQPIAPDTGTAESRSTLDRFVRDATAIIEQSGVRCEDMTDALGPGSYVTQGHFNEEGHREFARLLTPIIDEDLLGKKRTP